ncbi:transposase [Bacillus pseudomycoides]|nr:MULTISPECIES: TnsA endonuclease C-terminal domain-containing protein [Bacillus]PEP56597.1 transposase [Bacillus pseudomycoides]PHC93978.1 transposase [Bacillus pseudomycoides]
MSQQHIEDLAMSLLQRVLDTNQSIREITNIFDKETHMPLGSSMTLFYHLLALKIIRVDMLEPINVEQPIVIQSIDESKLKKVKYG